MWACRGCNSSKSDTDLLVWFAGQDRFPPLLLLRRYLKLAFLHFRGADLWEAEQGDPRVAAAPFCLDALPDVWPRPDRLELWTPVTPAEASGQAPGASDRPESL